MQERVTNIYFKFVQVKTLCSLFKIVKWRTQADENLLVCCPELYIPLETEVSTECLLLSDWSALWVAALLYQASCLTELAESWPMRRQSRATELDQWEGVMPDWSCCPYSLRSDFLSETVYKWDGEKGEEGEWTITGTILEERSNVGLSLVPLSSGVMDHCL